MATMHDYRRSSVGDIGTVPSTWDKRDVGEHQADCTLSACFDAMPHVWGMCAVFQVANVERSRDRVIWSVPLGVSSGRLKVAHYSQRGEERPL
jgi:hypothetical protein